MLVLVSVALVACGPQDEEGLGQIGTTADIGEPIRAGQCPSGVMVHGVDVSTYQGTVNWASVKASGQKFAIARVSDGSYIDSYFARNWSEMKKAGLIRGAYQFFEPGHDAVAQANLVIARVGKLGAGDLPVMLDMEVTGGQSRATITARIHEWVNAITAGTGKKPFVYTGAYFWDDHVGSSDFASLPLNVAWYGTNCPGTPNAWSHWTFHQYSSSGRVPGISGNVDENVYNGTLAQLETLAGVSAAPTPQPVNHAARGFLDLASCSSIGGWSQDPDEVKQPVDVVLSDGAYVAGNGKSWRVAADNNRTDLCTSIGSCNHGYSEPVPRSLLNGAAHAIHAYGVNVVGGGLNELTGSPRSITCRATFPAGVKRHVVNPASMAAYGFSYFFDMTVISDTALNGFVTGSEFPAARTVVKSPSSAAVWLLDGKYKRHIINPASLAAWNISVSAIKPTTDAALAKLTTGPELISNPILIKGSGDAVYVIDAPIPGVTSTPVVSDGGISQHIDSATPSADGGTTPSTNDDANAASDARGTDAAALPMVQSVQGCSTTAGAASMFPLGFALAALLLRARRAA